MKHHRAFATIIVCAVVLVAARLALWQRGPAIDPTCDHSSARTNAWGTKALRRTLERSGLEARTWTGDWGQLGDTPGTLWVIDPQRPPQSAQVRSLLTWVERGGTAVVVAAGPSIVTGVRPGKPESSLVTLIGMGWGLVRTGGAVSRRVTVRSADPLLRDVRHVLVPGPRRLVYSPPVSRLKTQLGQMGAGRDVVRHPPPPVRKLPGRVLIRDKYGTIAAKVSHGRGCIVLISEADILGNKWIREDDNVILAANLSFSGNGRAVWLHEPPPLPDWATGGLDTRSAHRALWAAVIALSLFALGKLFRLGPPVPMDPPPRRSAIEYVQAFASLFQRARQSKAALRFIETRFRARLAQAAGCAPNAPPQAMGAAVQRRLPEVDQQRVARALERCHEWGHTDARPSDADVVHLVRQISRIEQELRSDEH